jgi:membrane-bound ClpP family serine protease
MWTYIAIYLLVGALCFFTAAMCAARKKVSSSMAESIIDPILFLAVLSLWPLFFLNDILLYIPKQRRERFATVHLKRVEARTRRSTLRQKRDDYYAVVGSTGVAATDLRLAGFVRICGQNWDAISESGFIPANSPIEVTDRQGSNLLVKQLPA